MRLPTPFPDVDTPALLLDLDQVERNLDLYQRAADAAGVRLRPHAKAHKCGRLGALQVARGAVGLCCAKLGEAEVLAAEGLTDLLITTPVVGALKLRRLAALARTARVAVVVDDEAHVDALSGAAVAGDVRLDVLVEVDVGQGRTGVPPGARAGDLAQRIAGSPGLRFAGLQGYHGGLQAVPTLAERRERVVEAMDRLRTSLDAVRAAGLACDVVTGGGTGSFPVDLALGVLTELQPGSYITLDATYARVALGDGDAAHPLGQPLTVLATVISRPIPSRTVPARAIVDVGWKAASSDAGPPVVKGRPDLVFAFAGDEHGAISAADGGDVDLPLGARIELIPSHCDTTVNLYDTFTVQRGGVVEGAWPIEGRGRSR